MTPIGLYSDSAQRCDVCILLRRKCIPQGLHRRCVAGGWCRLRPAHGGFVCGEFRLDDGLFAGLCCQLLAQGVDGSHHVRRLRGQRGRMCCGWVCGALRQQLGAKLLHLSRQLRHTSIIRVGPRFARVWIAGSPHGSHVRAQGCTFNRCELGEWVRDEAILVSCQLQKRFRAWPVTSRHERCHLRVSTLLVI